MPEPADRLALIEMVESSQLVATYIDGFSRDAFLTDRRTCDAVTMQVFVLAEAANRLSPDGKALLGDIDWRQIRGLRNRIAHGYGSIDFGIVWEIASRYVPDIGSRARSALPGDADLPPAS
jgi:uncharacterized protein with HEPN domain